MGKTKFPRGVCTIFHNKPGWLLLAASSLSSKLWPNTMANPTNIITGNGSHISALKIIMLIPMAHITCSITMCCKGSNLHAKEIIVTSSKTSQRPLVNKKKLSSLFVFLCPDKKAEIPERNKNVGAQKWVIHLVKNKKGVVVARLVGSSIIASAWKKSRTWSNAIITITNPLKKSIDVILCFIRGTASPCAVAASVSIKKYVGKKVTKL